jgi:type VI secretion system protein ImpE
MTPGQLLDAGKLRDAVQALISEVRDNPTDVKRRTFLFELLCFAGEYDRAEKHLDVLSQNSEASWRGGLLYRAAMHAERLRHDMFLKKDYPPEPADDQATTALLNGVECRSFVDSDSRIGGRLEVFAAGAYLWIPFKYIESVEIDAPRRLRDLLWIPAVIRTGPAFTVQDLGEVLLPALSPFSSKNADDAVRLGRLTVWEMDESGEAIPSGQKLFLADDEEVPILEIRSLRFTPAGGTS